MGIVENYFDDIPKAILSFQLIEEALRGYLARCEVFTKTRVVDFIDYKLDLGVIEKASLGTLIDMFEKRNSNRILIKLLRVVAPERNFFAHAAYTYIYEKGEVDEDKVREVLRRLEDAIKNSRECFLDIWTESVSLENRFSGKKKKVTREEIDALYRKFESRECA